MIFFQHFINIIRALNTYAISGPIIKQLENGAEIESETETSKTEEISDDEPMDFGSESSSFSGDLNMDSGAAPEEETSETEISDIEETDSEETILPAPDELGQDFTNNDEF